MIPDKNSEEQITNPEKQDGISGNKQFGDFSLTPDDRIKIGWKCKRLIDFARLDYLDKLGYKVSLKFYIGDEVTPENVLLVALKE